MTKDDKISLALTIIYFLILTGLAVCKIHGVDVLFGHFIALVAVVGLVLQLAKPPKDLTIGNN